MLVHQSGLPGIARALAFVLGALWLSAAPAVAQEPSAPPAASAAGPEAEVAHVTAPIVLDGETLFRVRGTVTFPAEERARRIAERIEEVARTATIAPEAVQAVPTDEFVNVAAGDRFLLAVTDADARLESIDRAPARPDVRRPHPGRPAGLSPRPASRRSCCAAPSARSWPPSFSSRPSSASGGRSEGSSPGSAGATKRGSARSRSSPSRSSGPSASGTPSGPSCGSCARCRRPCSSTSGCTSSWAASP